MRTQLTLCSWCLEQAQDQQPRRVEVSSYCDSHIDPGSVRLTLQWTRVKTDLGPHLVMSLQPVCVSMCEKDQCCQNMEQGGSLSSNHAGISRISDMKICLPHKEKYEARLPTGNWCQQQSSSYFNPWEPLWIATIFSCSHTLLSSGVLKCFFINLNHSKECNCQHTGKFENEKNPVAQGILSIGTKKLTIWHAPRFFTTTLGIFGIYECLWSPFSLIQTHSYSNLHQNCSLIC